MSKSLPARPNAEYLHKEAKELLASFRRGDPATLPVVRHLRYLAQIPDAELLTPGRIDLGLQRMQSCLAIEYGSDNWDGLMARVRGEPDPDSSRPPVQVDRSAVAVDARDMFVATAGDEPLSWRHGEAFITALCAITRVGRRHGLVAITTLADSLIDEEPGRSGLTGLANGSDSDQIKTAMAEGKSAALAAQERRQAFVRTAIVRLGAGYSADSMRATLAELPSSDDPGSPVGGFNGTITGTTALDQELGRLPGWRRSTADLTPLFVAIAGTASQGGLVALDGVSVRIDDDLIQTGLQPLVDGADVELVNDIMEARSETLRMARGRRWDMIAKAVHGASTGTNQSMINAWCRAML